MASRIEVAAQLMEHMAVHAGHGYSQGSNRWGNGVMEEIEIDGEKYYIAGGDRDCSSGVISACAAAGIPVGNATYTGNMRSNFVATGLWEWKPMSFIAQRGDIYLHERDHTAMCTSAVPDMLAQFSIDENGNIVGGREGDQTGYESNIRGYYDYPWDGILHWVGETDGTAPAPEPAPSQQPEVRYRVYTQAQGWLPEMVGHRDTGGTADDFAGDGSPILYLAIDMNGWYQVRTRNGWLPKVRGYNVNDLEYGCAGDGTPVLAIRCYYETQHPETTGWLGIEYSVANVGGSFFSNMVDMSDTGGTADDFAGDGSPIAKFRAQLVRV